MKWISELACNVTLFTNYRTKLLHDMTSRPAVCCVYYKDHIYIKQLYTKLETLYIQLQVNVQCVGQGYSVYT